MTYVEKVCAKAEAARNHGTDGGIQIDVLLIYLGLDRCKMLSNRYPMICFTRRGVLAWRNN